MFLLLFQASFRQTNIISVSGHICFIFKIMSNCCQHKYDHSISRIFLNFIFGGILLLGRIVRQRANVARRSSLRWAGSAASKSSLSACRATIAGKPISSFRETVFSSIHCSTQQKLVTYQLSGGKRQQQIVQLDLRHQLCNDFRIQVFLFNVESFYDF